MKEEKGKEEEEESRAGARRSQDSRAPEEQGRGWYSRGYLPHADFPGILQSITYRLSDSLPTEALAKVEEELRNVDPKRIDAERRKRLEAWLDAGHGCCVLRDPRAAACLLENWRRFAGERYDLIAWVVMPNHVHLLIRTYEGITLGKIVQSWRNYTARRIREWMFPGNAERQLGMEEKKREEEEESRAGARRSRGKGKPSPVWMREYWDRYIRNERHFASVVDYIHQNPVKAGLARRAEEWPWSSAAEWAERAEEAP